MVKNRILFWLVKNLSIFLVRTVYFIVKHIAIGSSIVIVRSINIRGSARDRLAKDHNYWSAIAQLTGFQILWQTAVFPLAGNDTARRPSRDGNGYYSNELIYCTVKFGFFTNSLRTLNF